MVWFCISIIEKMHKKIFLWLILVIISENLKPKWINFKLSLMKDLEQKHC